MSKTGRNDDCPCMSGKKYKKCCMNNLEMINFFKKELNAQYIDGQYMIKNLLNGSDLLRNYLNDTLPSLKKPIIWLCNPQLNSNMRSIGFEETHGIIVKKVPINYEDYIDIAHEIGHLLLSEQNFPSSSPVDNDFNKMYLCTILNNTVLDPLINAKIKNYGFDFEGYMNKGIKIQIPIIKGYPVESILHKYDKHFLKCLLIEKVLEWRLLDKNINNPFIDEYKNKYPNIYEEAMDTIKYIDSIGYDNPDKVRLILNKILKDNMMENTIEII